ncbi:Outer membrane protein IcsA autotransporter precursor [compost metagenome]
MPHNKLICAGALSLLSLVLQQAHAACELVSTTGDDSYTCDAPSASPLNDQAGNNTLTASGSGNIASITFGSGSDRIVISNNAVIGPIQQGGGVDYFEMSGGQVRSLAQGDSRDFFLMSGGTITGAFEDGDTAKMTGGSIGRVDMKLDNNLFDMSGGTIIGNLVTGFGLDTILVSGGRIGGNISVSGGNDSITVTGGEIGGEIRASEGDDSFTWKDGGTIKSAVLMGNGNDTAAIGNLTEDRLAATPVVDGGLGTDQLTFDSSTSATPSRYIGWESVLLANSATFDLAGDFVLGDRDSGAGTFTIDGSSTLAATNGSIGPAVAGQLATLNNAGIIDLTSNGASAAQTLTVHGNYVGNNGQLWLQTVLADDTAASDKLVVSQGNISGNTLMTVNNLDGPGAATLSNGIEVVKAQSGATSSADAFTLKGGSIDAGAYRYSLFKGGVTAGTEHSWYLRNSVVAPAPVAALPPQEPQQPPAPGQPPAPVQPAEPAPALSVPTPAPGSPALPQAVVGADPIPLYREEVPLYSAIVPAAQLMIMNFLGTFHERQGEQSLLSETGSVPAGWGRVYGNSIRQSWSGAASPRLDGSDKGFQIGHDLYGSHVSEEYYQRTGLFIGKSRLRGDVDGFAGGFDNIRAGKTKLDGTHLGVYWTLSKPLGGYIDLVAMYSDLDGDSDSERGLKIDNDGHAVTLSAEAGYPFPVADNWVVEPQVQLINQHITLDDQSDGISDVSFDAQDYLTGRLGARLKGRYLFDNKPVEPYVRANVWRTTGGSSTVTYDNVDAIKTEHDAAWADLEMGVVTQLSNSVSTYFSIGYSANIDSNQREGVNGNAGLRISW